MNNQVSRRDIPAIGLLGLIVALIVLFGNRAWGNGYKSGVNDQ